MDEHDDVSRVRDRAIALYTFLKEFTELRTSTTRSLDQYEQVLWFSDIPREAECNCAAWHRGEDRESGEVWLEIRHPRLIAAPTPSEELAPWLVQAQVADSSMEIPELRPEIAARVEDETGEQRVEHKLLADHPEIKSLWERYVEARWWPWAEADRQAQTVQRVYTQLFSIYQKQQRLGEQYEVLPERRSPHRVVIVKVGGIGRSHGANGPSRGYCGGEVGGAVEITVAVRRWMPVSDSRDTQGLAVGV